MNVTKYRSRTELRVPVSTSLLRSVNRLPAAVPSRWGATGPSIERARDHRSIDGAIALVWAAASRGLTDFATAADIHTTLVRLRDGGAS